MFPLNLRADGHTSTWSARARMLLAFGYGVALHSDPFLSLVSLAALVWKDKKYQKPQKKGKTKKEEKITTTTKKQIKNGEFEVHLCKSIQELKRGCGRPGLFLLLILGLLLPTASASASVWIRTSQSSTLSGTKASSWELPIRPRGAALVLCEFWAIQPPIWESLWQLHRALGSAIC